jgi:hypothetical protein
MKDILKREIKADSNCIDAGSHIGSLLSLLMHTLRSSRF